MNKILSIFLVIFFQVLISLLIPIKKINAINTITLQNKLNFPTINTKTLVNLDASLLTFHFKNQIVKVNANNELIQYFNIDFNPNNSYITYPLDGSFFIEYPQLGKRIKMYDANGIFLWEQFESRYLKVFDSADWVLGLAGDHSRVHFFKPNMQKYFDVEGYLLTKYKINTYAQKESTDLNACLAFLDGTLFFIHLNSKKTIPVNSKSFIKNMDCNFKTGHFLLQTSTKTAKNHNIQLINIHTPKKPLYEIQLPANTFYSTPLALNQNLILYITWDFQKNYFVFNMFNTDNNQSLKFFIKDVLSLEDVDFFRVKIYKKGFLIHNKQHIWVTDTQGLTYKQDFKNIKKVVIRQKQIYIQSEKSIYLFNGKSI